MIIFYLFLIILLNIVKADEDANEVDANWMTHINSGVRINKINLPGTHDTGTFDIGQLSNNKILEYFVEKSVLAPLSDYIGGLFQTQSLDITEQLEHGIRYFDIRLALHENDTKLYLSHEVVPCYSVKNKYKYLYFSDVLDESITFLTKHYNETIVMHLKNENISKIKDTNTDIDISDIINNHINKTDQITETKQFKDFFYTDQKMPTLGEVRGKIVIITRDKYNYANKNIGYEISWNDMGGCQNYDNNSCCPKIKNEYEYYPYRIQDAYNLDGTEKWDLAHDVLDNTLLMCIDNEYNKNAIFNEGRNTNVTTINFMSSARARKPDWENLKEYASTLHDLLFDAGIEDTANYVNMELSKYIIDKKSYHPNYVIYNEWIPLDFPTLDVIRLIYQSNAYLNPFLTQNQVVISKKEELTAKAKYHIATIPLFGSVDADVFGYLIEAGDTILDVTEAVGDAIVLVAEGTGEIITDAAKAVAKGAEMVFDAIDDAVDAVAEAVADTVVSFFEGIFSKRSVDNTLKACLQRKTINNGQEIIKINYKCTKNPKNKWSIRQNGKFFNIISSYDNKCLIYKDNLLSVAKYNKNNKNEDFVIRKGVICSRVNIYKCMYGVFEFLHTTLESKKYDNLTCSSNYIKRGYKCCRNQNAKVEKVDNYGNWAKENGEWCGIGYERCSFEVKY